MSDAYRNGDQVLISSSGSRPVVGTIHMISPNQVSALIVFEGMLGNHAGMLAVMRHDRANGIYRSIVDGMEITMRVIPPPQQEGAPENGQDP